MFRKLGLFAVILFFAPACSDDSGGGGGIYAVYNGLVSPVDMTSGNITSLIESAMSEPQGLSMVQGLMDAAPVSGTFPCESGSGSVVVSLNGNSEGTISAQFNNCLFSGVLLNGTFDTTLSDYDAGLGGPTTSNIDMNLSMNISGIEVNSTGAIDSLIDVALGSITTTANLVMNTNITPRTIKLENFVTVTSVPDLDFPDEFDGVSYSGRVYLSDLGYMDISSGSELSKSSVADLYPSGGGPLVIAGQASESAEILPLSSSQFQLSLDEDGDSNFESVTTEAW